MNKDWFLVGTTLLSGFCLATGCSLVNAPSEIKPNGDTGGAGGASSSSSASATSSSSSSSGMGGAGGGLVCTPGSQLPCYEGPAMTSGVGTCREGAITCAMDGSGYGACEGQVLPAMMDSCGTPLFDENCDGMLNEGCPPEQVAILAALPPGYADDIRNQLVAVGGFMTVNVIDVAAGTPALPDLQAYQSVLVVTDKVLSNPVALGDVLATYYDLGGRVVLAMFATTGAGTTILGKFGDPTGPYMLMAPSMAASAPADDGLGMVVEPQNPIMQGVKDFSYVMAIKSTAPVINNGTIVAKWLSGAPLIVRGTAMGHNRVDVNLYPPQVQNGMAVWSGDVAVILRNALLY